MNDQPRRRVLWSMPLLGRELIEGANRKRTYVLRLLVVVLGMLIFGLVYSEAGRSARSLGTGYMVLQPVLTTLFAVILLLLPAWAVTSVTQEREQGTLILLLLTPMGPWRLVLQKFLFLNASMLVLLMGALPVLGVAYSMGGIQTGTIIRDVVGILLTIMELAALGLAIGSWARRSTGAVLLAYLAIVGLFLAQTFFVFQQIRGLGHAQESLLAKCIPWMILVLDSKVQGPGVIVMPLICTFAFLLFARLVIGRRTTSEGGQALLRGFRSLDRSFERIDSKLKRPKRDRDLPLTQPVLWLEVNRRSLANLRYLIRIFLPLYTLLFFLSTANTNDEFLLFQWTLGILLLPLIIIHASALAHERNQQTMEVLMTTPLTGLQYLKEKSRALARLRWAATGCTLIPLAGALYRHRYTYGASYTEEFIMIAGGILLPALCCWIALFIGVIIRNSRNAAAVAVIICLSWLVVLPVLGSALMWALFRVTLGGDSPLVIACPAILLLQSDSEFTYRFADRSSMLLIGLAGYIGLWWALRWGCLTWGGRRLYQAGKHSG